VAQKYAGKDFSIVAMVEHVDIYEQTKVAENVRFMLRQVDGALVSDRIAFPLEGMRHSWINWLNEAGLGEIWDGRLAEIGIDPTVVWSAIYSPDEVRAHEPEAIFENDVPVIYFISRLSDNQRTHYEEFFEACRLLQARHIKFQLWVANPNEAVLGYEDAAYPRGLNHVITHFGPTERAEYLNRLWKADIVPILYPQHMIYSLGFCEAITAGNLVLTHDTQGFPGMQVPEPTPEFIAARLEQMIEEFKLPMVTQPLWEVQNNWLTHDRSVEHNIINVRNTIEEVCREARGANVR
jgi:hypothetical protein